ncbi:leucyl aminopeptidase [Moniliophthora roreri MCA 2997]|uniref:Aminopeptidase n=1 Tax=Moniliophthora roreri (strain MCA 2997) TaxID=1381753 RepID=V2X026_MONRO|nr:leucyl aminopeptidase [Moniliophthora roreri MCA 2997]
MSSDYRLPTNVTPIHYDLTIRTDLKTSKFFGAIEIDLNINEESSQIILNALDLHIEDVSITTSEDQVFIPIAQSLDKERERATFHFPTKFAAGSTAKLHIKFDSDLTQNLAGYYKSSWKNKAGEVSFYALTQFEPTAARRAFPCWDEPALKATFGMNMISINNTVNLFNMPASSEESYDTVEDIYGLFASASSEKDREWKITQFDRTPKMSTYIVAYANGRLEYIESTYTSPLTGNKIPLRIYATASNIHQCDYALDVTAKVLAVYEKVFEIEYPLPKLDTLVADDFDAGAMENWGLIVGRASAYCIDPVTGSVREKQDIVEMQCHEVAHMWFGNITTMEWWTYLYLNEGFASLMGEAIIPDRIWPEWKMFTKLVSIHLSPALNLDSLLSAHPVEVDCLDANKISQIFDTLSYSKAASVLRMLSDHVGEEQFLKGVSIYLKEKLYGNSVTQDLWKGISAATGFDVSEMMENYITKAGYPVLTVTEKEGGIHVRQDRFLKTGLATGSDNDTIWHVPLNIRSVGANGDVSNDKAVLRDREADFIFDTKLPFKLNGSSTGYYRVLYSTERLDAIVTELTKENSPFDESDRLGLAQDVMAFARAGLLSFGSVLSTMLKFQPCREYLPWSVIAANWSKMTSLWWENPHIRDLLNAFGRTLFKPLINELGYVNSPSDSTDKTLLRGCAICYALQAGDKDVIQELKKRFHLFMETGDYASIPTDIEREIFTAAVRHGGLAEYEAVRKIIDNPRTPSSQTSAMVALCETEDLELIQKTFDYMLDGAKDQDVYYFFVALGQNVKTRRRLVEVFKERYDDLYARFRAGFGIGVFVKMAFENLGSDADYQQMKDFFEDKDTSTYGHYVSQCLDSIQANTQCIQQSTAGLAEWLEGWKA